MKILMTSETFLPRIGGAELHIYNLAKQLQQQGHKVIIFTNEEGGDENIVIRMKWQKKSLFKIIKILWNSSKDVDIIHSHYSYRLALLAGIIGKIRRIPVIVSLHGMGILDHPHTSFIYQQAHSLYRYLSLKLANYVISTSEDLARFAYNKIGKKKISIIPSGFDEKIFNRNIVLAKNLKAKYEDKKIIITVRRLVPKNGIHYLVEAMPYIIERIKNIKYIIVGDGNMADYIRERIKTLGIVEYIDMVGAQSNNRVPQYLKLANVVVFPSTAESASLACIEAMAMERLVVASRVGGLIELLGGNEERGRLVRLLEHKESNYDAPLQVNKKYYINLANTIVEAILDGDHIDHMRAASACLYAHDNLSWRIICKKTIEIYNKLKRDEI